MLLITLNAAKYGSMSLFASDCPCPLDFHDLGPKRVLGPAQVVFFFNPAFQGRVARYFPQSLAVRNKSGWAWPAHLSQAGLVWLSPGQTTSAPGDSGAHGGGGERGVGACSITTGGQEPHPHAPACTRVSAAARDQHDAARDGRGALAVRRHIHPLTAPRGSRVHLPLT